MLRARPHFPQEEPCPVPDQLIGELYRSSPHGLDDLLASVPTETRAMLALYCYRRAHLASIGLAIAASCEEHDLEVHGGNAGRALFEKSRSVPHKPKQSYYLERRKVTLSTCVLRKVVCDEDDAIVPYP